LAPLFPAATDTQFDFLHTDEPHFWLPNCENAIPASKYTFIAEESIDCQVTIDFHMIRDFTSNLESPDSHLYNYVVLAYEDRGEPLEAEREETPEAEHEESEETLEAECDETLETESEETLEAEHKETLEAEHEETPVQEKQSIAKSSLWSIFGM
jgi:hypothetical protein